MSKPSVGQHTRIMAGLTRLQMLVIVGLLAVLAVVVIAKKEKVRDIVQDTAKRMVGDQAEEGKEVAHEPVAADKLLPSSCFLYFSVPSLKQVGENFRHTSMYALWREPAVKEFLVEPIEKSQALRDRAEGQMGIGLSVLRRIFTGQVGVALFWQAEGTGKPNFAVIADCLVEKDRFEDIVYALLKRAFPPKGEQQTWKRSECEGQTIFERDSSRGPVFYAFVRDTFVLTLSKESIETLIKNYLGGSENALINNPYYDRVSKKLTAEKQIAKLYVNVDELLVGLRKTLGEETVDKVAAAGLASINAAGYGIGYEERGIKEIFYFYSPKEQRQGFAKLLTWSAGEKELLSAVPANVLSFSHANVEFESLWDGTLNTLKAVDEGGYVRFEELIASIEDTTNVKLKQDLVASLGNEIANYVMLSEEERVEEGSMVFLLKLKDIARATKSLEALLMAAVPGAAPAVATTTASGEPIDRYWAVTAHGNHSVRVLTSRTKELPVAPAYAVVGDMLIISPDTEAVRIALDNYDEERPSIKDDDDFKEVLAHLSPENSAISYFDLKEGITILHKKAAEAKGTFEGLEIPLNFAKLPSGEVISTHFFGLGSAAASDDSGLTIETYSPLGNLGSVFGASALASLMLPSSIDIRERITKELSRRNLLAVGKAMRAYAAKHGGNLPDPARQPSLLVEEGFVSNLKIFYSPATDVDPRTFPDNVSYQFTILAYNLERDSEGGYPIVWDRLGNHPGGRHVLFIDGHVEFLTEEAFLARIRNP